MDMEHFWGYEREDGRVGIRNKVAIVSTVHCSAVVAERIATSTGSIAITHQQGCMQLGEDLEQTIRILLGISMNPNVAAVLFVGLGCEKIHAAQMANKVSGKPVKYLDIQKEGSTLDAIKVGTSIAQELIINASQRQRTKVPLSKLVLAVKCGGSDPCSGLAANPALGVAADMLIEKGGSVILGIESLYGSEHLLAKRAATKEVGKKIVDAFLSLEHDSLELGYSFNDCNPTPGNIQGGITSMSEKALGAMLKAGSSPIVGMLKFGEIIPMDKPGLWMMDVRGGDIGQDTGYVAGGSQVVVFTTGRMTPVGDPVAPVIKLTGTKKLAEFMKENIDLSVHDILEGNDTLEEAGEKVFKEIIGVANGKFTKAEVLGHDEMYIPRIGSAV